MRIINRSKVFAFILFLISSFPALAWENERGLDLPVISSTLPSGVEIKSTSVTLKDKTVSIEYLLESRLTKTQNINFSIYLPFFTWQGIGAEYADRNIPEFEVYFDEKKVSYQRGFSAVHDGLEISRQLLDANIDPYSVATWDEGFVDFQSKRKNKNLKRLLDRNIFRNVDGVLIPNWYLSPWIFWNSNFSRPSHVIKVIYRQRPSFFIGNLDDAAFESKLLGVCSSISKKEIEKFKGGVIVSYSEYPVAIANALPKTVNIVDDRTENSNGILCAENDNAPSFFDKKWSLKNTSTTVRFVVIKAM